MTYILYDSGGRDGAGGMYENDRQTPPQTEERIAQTHAHKTKNETKGTAAETSRQARNVKVRLIGLN